MIVIPVVVVVASAAAGKGGGVTVMLGTVTAFNITDRSGSGILFKWNKEVDAGLEEGLVKEEFVPYPSITAKFPGVELEWDMRTAAIKDKLEPHGRP